MRNITNILLLTLLINCSNAQIIDNSTDSMPVMETATNGTWLKILYGLNNCPFKANDILYLKQNNIVKYVNNIALEKYEFQTFKTLYKYSVQCIMAPCPIGNANINMYYNQILKGSIKIQKGQYYFVDFYTIDSKTQEIKEGQSVWQFKAVTINKPRALKH